MDRHPCFKQHARQIIEERRPVARIGFDHRVAVRRAVIDQGIGRDFKGFGAHPGQRSGGEPLGQFLAVSERIFD